jgi:protein-L-isoaspartate(D-aspartate) O-methyltransferase
VGIPGIRSALLLLGLIAFAAQADEYARLRKDLVAEVQEWARLAGDSGDGKYDESVIRALRTVKRHKFVPRSQRPFAYENRPLPIGHGQTISQPYIVALMTDLVRPDADDVVLEIGTGSGYQAAILAEIVDHVYSIEIVEPLHESATERFDDRGYDNISTKLGDGYFGWEEHGPFDAIVVTAAASHVPPPLIRQLKAGGYLVIPVGGRFMTQQLLLIEKTGDDEIVTRQMGAVRFVPLTGER